MDEAAMLEFLRSKLSIQIKENFGWYGEHSITINLAIDDYVVSSDTMYMPKACNCKCGNAY